MKFDLLKYASLLMIVSVIGCSDEVESDASTLAPGYYKADVHKRIKEMHPDDVIVRVNGVDITKADYDLNLSLSDKVIRFKRKLGSTEDDNQKSVARHLEQFSRNLPFDLMRREVMRQGASKSGVEVSDKLRRDVYIEFAHSIGCKPAQFGSLEKKFGSAEFALLKRILDDEALIKAFYIRESTNSLSTVDEADFLAFEKKVKEFNVKADKANEKQRRKANKFREQVLAGADFCELGKKKSELHPEYAEEWDSYQIGELSDEGNALRKWLEVAKEGDVSEPIDLDDGLAVIKCLRIEKVELPAELRKDGDVYEYYLARCTFNAFQRCNELSREDITDFILDERRKQIANELGARTARESVIEYPNGDDFFPKK